MLRLSQRDPRWAAEKIGDSPYTVGRYGCTLTSVSMASDYFRCYKDPKWMARNLSYTKDGLILWQSIGKNLCFEFLWRFYTFNQKVIDRALKDPDQVCLLQVQNYHWVVAVRKVPFTSTYVIADPWTGTTSTTLRYNNQVTGGAVLKRK